MFDSYYFLAIFIVMIAAYALSYLLVRLKSISLLAHRKFWNYLLMLSFMISGLLGLILAFLIDQKYSILWYKEVLWMHVEFGIVMAMIAIFHLLWHSKYFLAYLSEKKTLK